MTAFDAAIKAASGETIIVFGYSQGTQVAQQWLKQHLNDSNAPSPEDLTFVLFSNSTRAYGGSLNVLGVFGEVWPQSQYQVIDVARQYEYSADVPNNPWSPYYGMALINGVMGGWYLHDYATVEDPSVVNDPANTVWKVGNTTYVLVPTENLPMVEPLREWGLTELADALQAVWKPQVDSAYNRNYPGLISPGVIASPQPAQTVTLDAAALRVSGGDVEQGGELTTAKASRNAGSANVQQDGLAVVSPASTPDSTPDDAVTTVKQDVEADTAVESTPGGDDPPSTAPTVPLINVKRDALKAEPGQLGGLHRKQGAGLASAAKSVREQFNSAITRITDGLRGGGETGEPSASDEAGTDGE